MKCKFKWLGPFYPKNWNQTKWIKYNFNHNGKWRAKRIPGVYVMYIDRKLAYVGQSVNILHRLECHRFRWMPDGRLQTRWGYYKKAFIKVKYSQQFGEWAMLEARLIQRLQPYLNQKGNRLFPKELLNYGESMGVPRNRIPPLEILKMTAKWF
jgi:hypothetical protein